MKIVTIIGARPQFIKAAAVSIEFSKKSIEEILIHTGQHYDKNMSQIFFDELGIPDPKHNLGIHAATHGAMTGMMLERIEAILMDETPDYVLVYGDTNSTLAGALAASKLHIPVCHVEAGLRSFNRRMPEEINRVLTDHVSDLLFTPTANGMANLQAEGIVKGVHHTGDVMYDAALLFGNISEDQSRILKRLGVKKNRFYLATIHRAENTDDPRRLNAILKALSIVGRDITVILPLHPRTKNVIDRMASKTLTENICMIQPLSYIDMVALEKNAMGILTDSGGVQKEAYFHGTPCITLRDETEWVETVESGWNTLAGADSDKILSAIQRTEQGRETIGDYGNGNASEKIVEIICQQ